MVPLGELVLMVPLGELAPLVLMDQWGAWGRLP
jgi:hypothetical protein